MLWLRDKIFLKVHQGIKVANMIVMYHVFGLKIHQVIEVSASSVHYSMDPMNDHGSLNEAAGSETAPEATVD